MKTLLIESIIESFTHSTIPKVEGKTDYKSIKEVEKLVIANASSCESELGGGLCGILGLVILEIKCVTITRNDFVLHTNPGVLSIFPPNPK